MSRVLEDSRTVLEGFFSAPIAKAILGAASKRAGGAAPEFQPTWYDAFFAELVRLLAVYLPDTTRRGDCIDRLDAIKMVVRPKGFSNGLRAPLVPRIDEARTRESRPNQTRQFGSSRRIPAQTAHERAPQSQGATSTSVLVRDEMDVPNACEVAKDLAKKLGFSIVDQTKMATAVSELARNMLQYAGGGSIRFAEVLAPRRGLEAFFEDRGPGIADLDGVLDPKYRSTTGMGMGLRGSKRIADEFLIDTQPGDGTRITMRKYVA